MNVIECKTHDTVTLMPGWIVCARCGAENGTPTTFEARP